MENDQEIIIVSNRSPIDDLKKGSQSINAGGLASALHQVAMEMHATWIFIADNNDYQYLNQHKSVPGINYTLFPVLINEKEYKSHYAGYSNSTIWPLFHYFPGKCGFKDEDWHAYCEVNRKIAEAISKLIKDKPNALIWVQDYHLFLVAKFLRELGVKNYIGFFLHIPFPAYEIFRILPQRKEILQGLLDFNLLGFHTNDYVSNFRNCVRKLLDPEAAPIAASEISYQNKLTYVKSCPISIDTKYILKLVDSSAAIKLTKRLRRDINTKFIGIGVDRLDYSKGIPEKLKALDLFFKMNRKYRGKLSFIQIAVPSRSQIDEYQKIKFEVEQTISRINGQYGSLCWQPIIYINRLIPFNKLISYYQIADFALITALRDGMNLVAKEFIAARKPNSDLILSELTGVADCFEGIKLVNPYNSESIAKAIKQSLESTSEQDVFLNKCKETLCVNDVHQWAKNFLEELRAISNYESNQVAV